MSDKKNIKLAVSSHTVLRTVDHTFSVIYLYLPSFLDPEGGSQKASLVVLVVVVISSLKIPKASLIRSRVQQNFAHTFVPTLPTDLPSQIFHLFSNLRVIS